MQTTETNVFENKHQSSKNVVFHHICVNQFQVGHLTVRAHPFQKYVGQQGPLNMWLHPAKC